MKRGKIAVKVMIFIVVVMGAWIFRKAFTVHVLGFLLTGALPGLSVSLPYWVMLLGYTLTILGVIALISYKRITEVYTAHTIAERKRRLPRRRYSQI